MQNNRHNNNNNNRRSRMNPPTSELDYMREIIYDYSENTYYYNSNMRLMIEYMRSIETNRQNHNHNYYQSSQRYRQRYTPPPLQQTHTNSPWTTAARTLFQSFPIFEDVVVRPTNFQIENAIETLIFDPSGQSQNTNTIRHLENRYCPITMEEFVPGHQLSRIKHCRHIFSQQALQNWFSVNVRCPICRYDIRETPINIRENNPSRQPTEINEDILDQIPLDNDDLPLPETTTTMPTTATASVQNNWRNITNVLRTFIQQELQNNPTAAELMYTFDIPFSSSNDLSANWF